MKKYTVVLSILFLTLSACKNEQDAIPAPIIEGTLLTIDEVKDFLPPEYRQESRLVYVNASNEEKRLEVSYSESISERVHFDNAQYKSEGFTAELHDPRLISFQIVILGSANYGLSGEVAKGINYMLMPFNDSGTTWVFFNFQNGMPVFDLSHNFQDTIEIGGKVFKDVFMARTDGMPNFFEAYSELDINPEIGVVAFRDRNNELWVFDRFEE